MIKKKIPAETYFGEKKKIPANSNAEKIKKIHTQKKLPPPPPPFHPDKN